MAEYKGLTPEESKKLIDALTEETRLSLTAEKCYEITPSGYDDRFDPSTVAEAFDRYLDVLEKEPDLSFKVFFSCFLWEHNSYWLDESEDYFIQGTLEDLPDEIRELYDKYIDANSGLSDAEALSNLIGYNGPTVDYGAFMPLLNINVMLATYDEANHDHTGIKLAFPSDVSDVIHREKDIADNALAYLIHQQGYTVERIAKSYYLEGYPVESKFEKSVLQELYNQTYDMGSLTVLAGIGGDNAFDVLEQIARGIVDRKQVKADDDFSKSQCLLFSKDAMLGIFDPWNGAGSMLEIELDKPLVVPVVLIDRLQIEGAGRKLSHGYTVDEVYGLISSCWNASCVVTDQKPELVKEDPETILEVFDEIENRLNNDPGIG